MRILLLTDGIFPFVIGGMQKHSYYLAKEFLRKGVDLTVYHCVFDKEVPANSDSELSKYLEVNEKSTLSIKCFKFPRLNIKIPGHYVLESYLYSKLLYNELIKEKQFDFIYAKGFSAWYTLSHNKGLPKIGVQFHGMEMFQNVSSFKDYLAKLILQIPVKYNLKLADFVFSYGGKIKKIHLDLGCPENKVKIQHGGIQSSLLIPENQIKNKASIRKFLFIGRNERRKGYIELKEALTQIIDKYDFHFSFIGEIKPNERIISDKIHYYGNIIDIDNYYEIIDQHDVIVVPSISEGLPTVIIESMSRGLCALATDVGAVQGIVNNTNGFLIESGNVPQIVLNLIKIIEMTEEDLLVKKQNSLKMIKENFNWDKLSDDLLNFIESKK